MESAKSPWNPYAAGVLLGLVTLGSFVLTGRGIGASAGVKGCLAGLTQAVAPTWSAANEHLSGLLRPDHSPFNSWAVWMLVGTLAGGLLGALTAGRFRWESIRGPRIGVRGRWALAFAGGVLSGWAAQLARGCTSGQGITGGAQLALGSWVFLLGVFAGGYALAWFLRRQWI